MDRICATTIPAGQGGTEEIPSPPSEGEGQGEEGRYGPVVKVFHFGARFQLDQQCEAVMRVGESL